MLFDIKQLFDAEPESPLYVAVTVLPRGRTATRGMLTGATIFRQSRRLSICEPLKAVARRRAEARILLLLGFNDSRLDGSQCTPENVKL